jgi:hypothetical protein
MTRSGPPAWWRDKHAETLRLENPYRSVHVPKATHSNPSKIGSPWLLLSETEIAAYLLAHREVTTPSAKIQRCLTWLAQEFGP